MVRVIPTTPLVLHGLLSPALLLSLALTLLQPAMAQINAPPPLLVPAQHLTPTDAEIYPTPGAGPREVGFGTGIALQRDTALISMPSYQPNAGRVAVFKRDDSGQWEREGSIDPASTPGVYGDAYAFGEAITLRGDYALIMSTTANYLYRKDHDQWKLLDLVPAIIGADANGETLAPPFVFFRNNVYRIGPQGKLQQTQTLVGDDPTFSDAFGNVVSASDGTLVISATSDSEDRGALYTFEERDGMWVKRQKIVTNDGAVGDELGTSVVISGDIMAAAAAGKDYKYIDPSCNGQPTSGVVYIFARVRGVWTQQQEIVNPCIYGFQFIQLDRDWLSVSYPTFAFGTQNAGTLVYRRENHSHGNHRHENHWSEDHGHEHHWLEKQPRMSDVNFVPYGTVVLSGNPYQILAVLHDSTLFRQNGGDSEFPGGMVDVYDLCKRCP